MKQIYYFTLALGILFSTTTFVSCGGDDEKSNPENTTPQKTADRDEMGNIKINAANFPDAAFRNYLYDKYGADGVLTEVEIDNVTKLELEYRGIKTLEGIEFFPLLEVLKCNNNQLTSLDVSKNTKLTGLECYSNPITSLNVSGCTALTDLECSSNSITSLDVSSCTGLWKLVCVRNLLTSLDVSKNTKLTELYCGVNQLTSLNVSGCTALTTLYCQSNQLTSLNVSGCTALTDLECYQNQISGAAMDKLVESLPTKSDCTMRVIYFGNDQNEMTTTQVAAARAKGWMPYCSTNGAGWYEYDGINPAAK